MSQAARMHPDQGGQSRSACARPPASGRYGRSNYYFFASADRAEQASSARAPSSAAAAERAARQIGLSSHPARSAIISPASPPPSPRHRRSPMLRARSDAAALEAAAVKDTAELLTVCPLIWTLRRHARVAGCSLPHGARSPGPWPAGCAQERGLHCRCWQHWPDRCGPGGGPALVHVECAPHWSVPCQALPPPPDPCSLLQFRTSCLRR